MTLLREWGACAAVGVVLSGCGQVELPDDPHASPRPGIAAQGLDPRHGSTVRVEVGPASARYCGPGYWAMGADRGTVEEAAARAEHAILEVDGTSDPELIAGAMKAFKQSHGFWQEITLAERDPDARYAEHEAKISLDKASYSEYEPILLTIDISRTFSGHLTPEHVRIVNDRAEEVNTYLTPVSGTYYMASISFASETSRTIDLTSFAEPRNRTEYVHRFAPGRYTATFHFSVGYPEWKKPFHSVRKIGPRVWGAKKSNTVSFEVRASDAPRAETGVLISRASGLAKEKRWDEAVAAYKRAIIGMSALASIREAIRQIIRIRAGLEGGTERNPHGLEFDSLRLALLHVPEPDRREFCRHYVRAFDRMIRDEDDAAGRELLDKFSLVELFEYPQFRKILEEQVRRPDECPYPFARVYVEGLGDKDPAVMAGLLPRYPGWVLEHYAWHKAPPEIVPLFPQYFGSETEVWQSGPMRWYCKDAAFMALELAAGLNLGYRNQRDRIHDRAEIEKLMRRWWHRHGHRF